MPTAFDASKREWFDIFSGEERLPGEFGHWTGRGIAVATPWPRTPNASGRVSK